MAKIYWILLICLAGLFILVGRLIHHGSEKSRVSHGLVSPNLWTETALDSIEWKVDEIPGKVPGMKWRVIYTYTIGGVHYTGRHIDPDRDSLLVDYSQRESSILRQLQSLQKAWYNSGNPGQSVLFKSGDAPL